MKLNKLISILLFIASVSFFSQLHSSHEPADPKVGDLSSSDGYNVQEIQEVQQPQYPAEPFHIELSPQLSLQCWPMKTQPNAYLCSFVGAE